MQALDMRSPRLFFERSFEANNISIDLTCHVASAERELPLLFAPDLPNVPSFLPRRGCNKIPTFVAESDQREVAYTANEATSHPGATNHGQG